MFTPSKYLERFIVWYQLKVKGLEESIKRECEERLSNERIRMLTDVSNAQRREAQIDKLIINMNRDSWGIVIDKTQQITKKEQMDIEKIVNSEHYISLRSYYLKTTMMLYEKAAGVDKEMSHVLVQFADLLKNFVLDMDRMKVVHAEEAAPDPYDS
jgi:hypothetical protein